MHDEEMQHKEQLDRLNHDHSMRLDDLQNDNVLALQEKQETYTQLTEKIRLLERQNKDKREDQEREEWNKIDEIKESNKKELYKVTMAGLESKSELTITNKLHDE